MLIWLNCLISVGVGKIFWRPVYDGFYEKFKPYFEKKYFTFFNINDINANFALLSCMLIIQKSSFALILLRLNFIRVINIDR